MLQRDPFYRDEKETDVVSTRNVALLRLRV